MPTRLDVGMVTCKPRKSSASPVHHGMSSFASRVVRRFRRVTLKLRHKKGDYSTYYVVTVTFQCYSKHVICHVSLLCYTRRHVSLLCYTRHLSRFNIMLHTSHITFQYYAKHAFRNASLLCYTRQLSRFIIMLHTSSRFIIMLHT
jgi:hypothetical protein